MLLCEAPVDEECVLTVELDLSAIARQRHGWPFLRDRRIDAYENIGKRFARD
jgi:N-carbamoylputrescine amidase